MRSVPFFKAGHVICPDWVRCWQCRLFDTAIFQSEETCRLQPQLRVCHQVWMINHTFDEGLFLLACLAQLEQSAAEAAKLSG